MITKMITGKKSDIDLKKMITSKPFEKINDNIP
jgi:hypothetical protein